MADGDTKFSQTLNPNSWNKIANMIYLEAPAGVGYSWSNLKKPAYTDDSSAEDNYLAVKKFFSLFGEYADNEFYISGESYAGVYVPFLAHKIAVQYKDDNSINLKGILVGNGVTDLDYDDTSLWAMGFWHGVIDYKLERKMFNDNCYPHQMSTETQRNGARSPRCEQHEAEWISKIAGINIYDVYRKCYYPETPAERFSTNHLGQTYKNGMTAMDYTPWMFKSLKKKGLTLEDVSVPCVYAKGTSDFFNTAEVMAALHINTEQVKKWQLCTDEIDYTHGIGSLHLYEELRVADIRIVHFSGNTDAAVPTTGTRQWVFETEYEVLTDWAPFYVGNNQIGGFGEIRKGITFVTAQGVGHMVPQWAPEVGYYILEKFLKNEPIIPDQSSAPKMSSE